MRRSVIASLAVVASLVLHPAARGGPAEDCLEAPSVGCITEHFAEEADLPLLALPDGERHGYRKTLLQPSWRWGGRTRPSVSPNVRSGSPTRSG